MLQFSEPIWLFTATAITLPLLIHLWNLRKGKRLKIGSLLLITQSIQPTARQLRLTEWLLLVLRCLLIALLAILLSGPYWQNKPGNNNQKGWILIPKESISHIYPVFKTQIDSLLQSGYQLHAFNFPFESISINTADTITQPVSYWQRLAQLNNRLPAGFPAIIFSDGSMQHFDGIRPDIALSLQWHVLPATSENKTLIKATRLSNDSIAIKFLASSATKNIFIEQHISPNTTIEGIRFPQTSSGRFVQWQQDQPVLIDTNTLRIAVYQKKSLQDARYLHAALEAIRPLLDQRLQVTEIKDAAAVPKNQDWIFWLSDEPFKADPGNKNYFAYAAGDAIKKNSRILTKSNTSAISSFDLYQRINNTDTGEMIWKDGFGQPLLTKVTGNIYHFYSRFDPSWNNLVWNAAFPELVFNLIQNNQSNTTNDLRQIDTAQLSFVSSGNTAKTGAVANRTALSPICWWLLLLCFAMERWFSLHPKTKKRAA